MPKPVPYYTQSEAARKLGVTRQRVQRLIDEGRIAERRTIGGSLLIPASSLKKYKPMKPGRPRNS